MATKHVLKKVKDVTLPIPDEDGTCVHDKVALRMRTADPIAFVIELPQFVADALGMHQAQVEASIADNAIGAYKLKVQEYIDWPRKLVAQEVIAIRCCYKAGRPGDRWVKRDDFSLGSGTPRPAIAFDYERMLRVDENMHTRRPDGSVGARRHVRKDEATIVDWSPELEAKLIAIRDVVTNAAYALDALLSSDNVAAALLAAPGALALAAPTVRASES
jgi:hypothetical protein